MYTAFAQINSNKKITSDNQISMLRFKNVVLTLKKDILKTVGDLQKYILKEL